jgi:hypothetical protein
MTDALTLGALKRLSYPQFSSKNSLTALAGGGQTGATLLPASVNVVATVVNPGDSVMLPKEGGGKRIVVINAGASSLNVFPNNATDVINSLAVQTAYAVPAGDVIEFVGSGNGQWYASVPSIDTLINLTLSGYLARSNAAAVTAAGTTQGTATALTADQNNVATGTANQGVVLPTGVPGMRVLVWNSTGATIKIYPAGTGTIDGGGASAAVTLTSAHRAAEFFCQSANTWVSAIVGAAST